MVSWPPRDKSWTLLTRLYWGQNLLLLFTAPVPNLSSNCYLLVPGLWSQEHGGNCMGVWRLKSFLYCHIAVTSVGLEFFLFWGEGSPRAALFPHLLPWICPPHPNTHQENTTQQLLCSSSLPSSPHLQPSSSSSCSQLLPSPRASPNLSTSWAALTTGPIPMGKLTSEPDQLQNAIHLPSSLLQTHPETVTALQRLRGELSSTAAQAINSSGRPNGCPGPHSGHHCSRLSKPCCNFQQSISSTEPNSDDNLKKPSLAKKKIKIRIKPEFCFLWAVMTALPPLWGGRAAG